MYELIETFSSEWAIRALLASSLVGVMCGVIGCFIVLRNMSLIGDALAHAILPGIVVAFFLLGYSTIGFFFGSVIAGLIAAVTITWIQHKVKTKNDAAIGIVFTAMFSIGVIGISYLNTAQGVHLDLKDFLFGTVLGISNEDIILTAIVTTTTLIGVIIFYRYLFITTFQPVIAETMGISVKMVHYLLMLLLSFAVVSSLRTVGVILVVAMLITPASTALLLSNKLKNVVIISGITGLLSAILGLVLAILFDTTPGPAMCITATLLYFLAVVFSPTKGLLRKMINTRNQKWKIEQEDIIKWTSKLEGKGEFSFQMLQDRLKFSTRTVKNHIQKLKSEGIISGDSPALQLTVKGKQSGAALVRAHRLWETYLVDEVGLGENQIHEEAERLEHVLTEEMVDEVDRKLGFPSKDPHGAPIPQKEPRPDYSLLALKPRSKGRIAKKQISDAIESELWELGLMPNVMFLLDTIGNDFVTIKIDQKTIRIPDHLAKKINIQV